jgi:hypothetical protein
MKKCILAIALLLSACAGDDSFDQQDSEVASSENELTTRPWYPSGDFNETYRGPNYYWNTTPWNYLLPMTTGSTEYAISGEVTSGDNTTFWIGNVDWSLTLLGTGNACVLYGCAFWLCWEDPARGLGTCTQVLGQGTNSSNPELHGTTSHFYGLRHRAYSTVVWTMYIQTYAYWPYPGYVEDFTLTVRN